MGATHPAKEAKCSKRQIDVFEQIAIGMDGGHHPATLRALKKKGLIASTLPPMGRDAIGTISVYRYHVPLHIHVQWCEWCAQGPAMTTLDATRGEK